MTTFKSDKEPLKFEPVGDYEHEPEDIQVKGVEDGIYMSVDALEDKYSNAETHEDKTRPPEPEFDSAMVKPAIYGLLSVAGDIITMRAGVSSLNQSELNLLSDNIVNVLEQYPDVGGYISPKAAAWLGLGMASLAVIQPRIQEKRENLAKDVTPETGEAIYPEDVKQAS